MTREEAIKSLKTLRGSINGVFDYNCRIQCASLDMAIKALESGPLIVPIAEIKYDEDEIKELISKCVLTVTPQEPKLELVKAYSDEVNEVLDKIRAEIEQNAYPIVHGVNSHEKGMTLYGILQVIDKYKSESEDKE